MSESRSELFQLGFDVLGRKHELNRATTFKGVGFGSFSVTEKGSCIGFIS